MKSDIRTIALFATVIFVFITGCAGEVEQSLWDQIKELKQEKNDLQLQIETLQNQNRQLTEQIRQLSALSPQVRIEAMPQLSRVDLSQRTGLYDKDKNDQKESLIVYLKPFDETGDTIKAAGGVHVQLWDLESDTNKLLLGDWNVTPNELKKLWSGTVMTNYYRLAFDVSDLLSPDQKELTLKVTFTDYVTGKVFRKQKAIQP